MQPEFSPIICGGHGGWFTLVVYIIDLFSVVAILSLFLMNLKALISGDALARPYVTFRLLVSKRITQLLGLFCAFQFSQFLVFALFILSTSDRFSSSFIAVVAYNYRHIVMTFTVIAFGMIQYALIDAVQVYQTMKQNRQ